MKIIVDKGTNSETIIVTVYNDQNDIMQQVHTVCITKESDGTYTLHNISESDATNNYIAKGGYSTLNEAINEIKANPKVIYTIGINN